MCNMATRRLTLTAHNNITRALSALDGIARIEANLATLPRTPTYERTRRLYAERLAAYEARLQAAAQEWDDEPTADWDDVPTLEIPSETMAQLVYGAAS